MNPIDEAYEAYKNDMYTPRSMQLLDIFNYYGDLTGNQIRALEKIFFTLFYKHQELQK